MGYLDHMPDSQRLEQLETIRAELMAALAGELDANGSTTLARLLGGSLDGLLEARTELRRRNE